MSRQLAPRAAQVAGGLEVPPLLQRPRKISTACGACKQRKTRCSGGNPCDACSTRNSHCIYDASSDQRRKVANQRNVQDLAEAQSDLERHRQLLGGIIATIRVGDAHANQELVRMIRSRTDLSQLAAYVRNECRSNPDIQQAYGEIEFIIDGEDHLPSPTQILRRGVDSAAPDLFMGSTQSIDPSVHGYGVDFSLYGIDGDHAD